MIWYGIIKPIVFESAGCAARYLGKYLAKLAIAEYKLISYDGKYGAESMDICMM